MIDRVTAGLARLRAKNLHGWTAGYARWLARSALPRAQAAFRPGNGPRHLLFAFCDHYEPLWKAHTDRPRGHERVRAWHHGYPVMAGPFRDADGRPPRHSFFFPGEEYDPGWLDALAKLTKDDFGEVELHLHHDQDTR